MAMPASPSHAAGPAGPDGLLARLAAWDRTASRRIAVGWPHPHWFTLPLAAVSSTANNGVLWFVLAALPWAFGVQRGPARFVSIAGSVLGTEILTFGLKVLFDRRRPPEREPGPAQLIALPRSRSFPSSHASMGMVGLLTTAALYPDWWAPLAVLVAVLAFSRIYLRVHYLADVLAGLVLGTVLGLLITQVVAAPR
jgi:undecaprenyl-diphosphatase